MLSDILASNSLNSAIFLQAVGGPFGTVPELLFEKKKLIPELQRLLVQADNT
jgi:hypothetical protein